MLYTLTRLFTQELIRLDVWMQHMPFLKHDTKYSTLNYEGR